MRFGSSATSPTVSHASKEMVMLIKILGTGCPKCNQLYANTQTAIELSGRQIRLEKVEDIQKITDYGVLMIPGLVIDEKVISSGKVLNPQAILKLISP
jgi:small redox-active disulfide protein 2